MADILHKQMDLDDSFRGQMQRIQTTLQKGVENLEAMPAKFAALNHEPTQGQIRDVEHATEQLILVSQALKKVQADLQKLRK